MSTRAPRRKPTGKAKKPPALPSSDNDAKAGKSFLSGAANTLPKWAESLLAQKDGHSARLPSPDDMTVPQLWEHFEYIAYKLWSRCHSTPDKANCSGLGIVIELCLLTLRGNLWLGGDKAEEAAEHLLEATRWGEVFLSEATLNEKSLTVLKRVASKQKDWPVLLSLKEKSYQEAKKYLQELGVGTVSNPPTAKTKIDAKNPWTELAVMLTKKIISSRRLLRIQTLMDQKLIAEDKLPDAKKWTDFTSHPSLFMRFERELPEALKWKQVSDLPAELNKEAKGKWWGVAKEMLKDYLAANPFEAARLFKLVKTTAQDEAKRPATIVIKSVREAFYAIVASRSFANN